MGKLKDRKLFERDVKERRLACKQRTFGQL